MPLFGTKPEAVTSIQAKRLTDEITALSAQLAELRGEDTVIELGREIEELKHERDGLVEANKRASADVEHKLGLHRQQVEAERAQMVAENEIAREKDKLAIERGNLETERAQFQSEMTFRQTRFDEEMARLQSMSEQILQRLPDVNATISVRRGDHDAAGE